MRNGPDAGLSAVPGQVPGHYADALGKAFGGRFPQGRGRCAKGGPEQQQPRARGAAEVGADNAWRGHVTCLEVMAGALENGVDEVVDRPEVAGLRRAARQFGHRLLFGEYVTRRGQIGLCALGVDLEGGDQFRRLGGRHDGAPRQGAQGGPFGVPAAVGPLVHLRPPTRCAVSRRARAR